MPLQLRMKHVLLTASALLLPAAVTAQATGSEAVIRALHEEGTERSQVQALGQVFLDSLGPRLTGTPNLERAGDWVIRKYAEWGIPASFENYGTWKGWRRGITHLDLLEPRVRTLEGTLLAWSPGSPGTVEGSTAILPIFGSPEDVEAFLGTVRGKFVLWSFPEPTCRPNDNWEQFAVPEHFERMRQERDAERNGWADRFFSARLSPEALAARIEDAGALGILTSRWSNGWGVNKIFGAQTTRIPQLDLSCEDYGLVFRLTEQDQSPQLRLTADAEFLGDVPVGNVIARVEGSEKPDEYVLLSAHFDSWDGGSGATDNGTGTLVMLEAMRILSEVYPNPKRTIVAGHWNGEEQGLNGSRAFVADNPEIVEGLQALFNQDNGTGRVVNIGMQGLAGAEPIFRRWLAQLPRELTQEIELAIPGMPSSGGTDHASFICAGAPAFGLGSLGWDYSTYTWHTNRDTFDKVIWEEVRNNAVLTAMLVYLASEDPEFFPRDRAELEPNPRTGQIPAWPSCIDGQRAFGPRS